MSKQNQIKDFLQNSRRAKRVVNKNKANSIALDLYSKNPYITAKDLRTISLKLRNSFRLKLFVYRLSERTLSMAETALLQV